MVTEHTRSMVRTEEALAHLALLVTQQQGRLQQIEPAPRLAPFVQLVIQEFQRPLTLLVVLFVDLARIRLLLELPYVRIVLLEPTDHRLAFRLTPVVELLPVLRVNTL